MTENEAIKQIQYRIYTAGSIVGNGNNGTAYEDLEMAIQALEEIQQYRAIGTVEELQAYKNGSCTNNCSHYDNVVEYIRNKAIDEFAEVLRVKCLERCYREVSMYAILEIAEQLKGEK